MALKEAKVRLTHQDLLNLADNLNRLNTMDGVVLGAMEYGTIGQDSITANFGLEFDVNECEHVITFASLVRVNDADL